MPGYRSEIDGLRALAVLPVMAFHAGLAGWQGGYLGVDVFFVISGYLITGIILAEQAQGTFSLAGFWERRARRILPLLSVVVLACLPLAWVLLGWKDSEDLAQSLFAVATFTSNLLFWREGTYFDIATEYKLLFHTWSLAVEEQFYLLFPLLCLAVFRWGRRIGLALVLGAGCAVSLGIWIVLARSDPSAAFYLLPARGWQLLTGALCALALAAGPEKVPRAWREAGAIGGLALIIGGMTVRTAVIGGINLSMLAVTGGTALVILLAGRGTLAARVLSWRPMVAIGLVSYGAYLWHVPMLVFARHVIALSGNPELERATMVPPALAIGLCVASLLLAAVTWRLVEQPCRKRQGIPLKALLVSLAAAWVIILGFAATLLLTDWQQRFHASRVLGADADQAEQYVRLMAENEMGPFARQLHDRGPCVFGSEELGSATRSRIEQCAARHGPGILLIGDSHAIDLHNALASMADADAFLVTIAAPGCRIGLESCFYQQVEQQLATGLSGAFGHVFYTQAGSLLILDERGRGDSQDAFVRPDMASFDHARIDEMARLLRHWQQALRVPLEVLGPFYEPRINLERGQPLTMGWVPRATVRGQFEQLDGVLRAAMGRYGLPYTSMLVAPLAPQDRVLDKACLIYHDLDHLSACGEVRMGEQLEATGHPLARLLQGENHVANAAR